MSRVFASYLNAEEMKEVLVMASKATAYFFIEHFVQWAKDEGLDFKPALEFLSKAPWTLDQV
jgi:pyrroline-5-carboxylate reductase